MLKRPLWSMILITAADVGAHMLHACNKNNIAPCDVHDVAAARLVLHQSTRCTGAGTCMCTMWYIESLGKPSHTTSLNDGNGW